MSRILGTAAAAAIATIAAAAWAAGPSRTLDDYVIFGVQGVRLKNLAHVSSGDVGVNDPATSSAHGLMLSRGDVLDDGTQAVADVARASGAVVFDLFANRVPGGAPAAIRGAGPQPTGALPLIDPLPPLPAFAPGTTTVLVSGHQTLAPGAYGRVVVGSGAQLDLQAGTYEFLALQTSRNAGVFAFGPVVLDVATTLRVGNATMIGPRQNGLTADDVVVNVGGTSVVFGAGVDAVMKLYAPKAHLVFGRSFAGTGQFVGRLITTDHATHFSRGDCGNGVVEQGEQCDPPDGTNCDAHCRLVASTSTTTTTSEPTTTTTTTTMPVAVCGDGKVEWPEECDPPASSCPPNGICGDDCLCFFSGS